MKAVALLSGGLDSQLAIKIIKEQNIEVEAVNFITPFFGNEAAKKASQRLNIPLRTIDITFKHLDIVKNPKYGYGKYMNPCIDCHALMIKEAGRYMKEISASFLITGEVLGQRPKSQNKEALTLVERESGWEGFILRPLSAKLLPITIPEKEGWIDRERLFSFSGRSRKAQMELAKSLNISEYPSPAGGCKLTEEVFSRRLKDLFNEERDITIDEIHLLKVGRHFRLNKKIKLIVGRNKAENETILKLAGEDDILLTPSFHKGPITLLKNGDTDILKAAMITARYSDIIGEEKISIKYWKASSSERNFIKVSPIMEEELRNLRI
jgi:tRNA U34 2-thiouridine synthase MnmA/TrmU